MMPRGVKLLSDGLLRERKALKRNYAPKKKVVSSSTTSAAVSAISTSVLVKSAFVDQVDIWLNYQ